VLTNGVRALEALGDPTRRALFESLARGPRAVGELAEIAGVSSSAVSQHLKVLRAARLVMVRARGNHRMYSLDPRGLGAARDYLDQYWPSALAAYSAALAEAAPDSELG